MLYEVEDSTSPSIDVEGFSQSSLVATTVAAENDVTEECAEDPTFAPRDVEGFSQSASVITTAAAEKL